MSDSNSDSAMTIGAQPAPLATATKRKGKRAATPLNVQAVSTVQNSAKVAASNLKANQNDVSDQAYAEYEQLVENVFAKSGDIAEARAMVLAAQPALIQRLTAEKLAELQAQMPATYDYSADLAAAKALTAAKLADFFSLFED